MAARPAKNRGVRKDIADLSDAHQALAARKVAEERAVEGLGGVEERVVDAMLRELRRQRFDVGADQGAVLLGERLRDHRNLLAALEVLEAGSVVVLELELGRIE